VTDAAITFAGFGLAHRRAGREETLLHGVDLALPTHGFYAFVGASGGGKSSVLRLLAGLVEPREPAPRVDGDLVVLGHSFAAGFPASLRGDVAAILQDEGLLDERSPRANVELALRQADRSPLLAAGLLAQVGLEHAPDETARLSGGMRKRLAVARALASSPRLLLCDEPTAGLDPAGARTIAALLRDAHDQDARRTTLIVTHDLPAFAGKLDGMLVLDRARRTLRLEGPDYEPTPSDTAPAPDDGAVDASEALHGVRTLLLQSAAFGESLLEALRRLPPCELRETARATWRACVEPAPFVVLGGGVLGGLATFFALQNNPLAARRPAAHAAGLGHGDRHARGHPGGLRRGLVRRPRRRRRRLGHAGRRLRARVVRVGHRPRCRRRARQVGAVRLPGRGRLLAPWRRSQAVERRRRRGGRSRHRRRHGDRPARPRHRHVRRVRLNRRRHGQIVPKAGTACWPMLRR